MTSPMDLVRVEDTGIGYVAVCQEHGDVALKQTDDDAHLAAARHLARVHVGPLQIVDVAPERDRRQAGIPRPAVLSGSRAWNEWDD